MTALPRGSPIASLKFIPSNSTNNSFIGTRYYSKPVEDLLTSLYIITGITAVGLNALVCVLYAKGFVKKSSFNQLLVMLASSDMASAFAITPYVFLDMKKINVSRKTFDFLCGIVIGLSQYWACVCVSAFILCLISLNRYILINYPTKRSWTRNKKKILVSFIVFWLLSTAIWTSNIFTFRFDKSANVCYRDWPEGFNALAYLCSSLTVGIMIPFFIMMYTFVTTSITLWTKTSLQGTDTVILKKRKRIISSLGLLILAHVSLSLPTAIYWILSLATRFFSDGVQGEYQRLKVMRITIFIALCSAVVNPLIYSFRIPEFGNAMKLYFSSSSRKSNVISLDARYK